MQGIEGGDGVIRLRMLGPSSRTYSTRGCPAGTEYMKKTARCELEPERGCQSKQKEGEKHLNFSSLLPSDLPTRSLTG